MTRKKLYREAYWLLISAGVGTLMIASGIPVWKTGIALICFMVFRAHVEDKFFPVQVVQKEPPLAEPEPEQKQEPAATVPFMVTADMVRRLRDLGLSDDRIRTLKPDQAWKILKEMEST